MPGLLIFFITNIYQTTFSYNPFKHLTNIMQYTLQLFAQLDKYESFMETEVPLPCSHCTCIVCVWALLTHYDYISSRTAV